VASVRAAPFGFAPQTVLHCNDLRQPNCGAGGVQCWTATCAGARILGGGERGGWTMMVGLSAWLVMLLLVRGHGVGLAVGAFLAAVVAAGSAMWARRRGMSGAFETVSCGAFLTIAVAGWLAPASLIVHLGRYDRALTAAVLAALCLASLLVRPLTTEYTRELVPLHVLPTRVFAQANVVSTAAVGVTALAAAASFLIGTVGHDSLLRTVFDWLVPVALAGACAGYLNRQWHVLRESDDLTAVLTAALETPTRPDVLDLQSPARPRAGTDVEDVQTLLRPGPHFFRRDGAALRQRGGISGR